MQGAKRISQSFHKACLVLALSVAYPTIGSASPTKCGSPLATLVAIRGEVRVKSPDMEWRTADLDQDLCAGDEIEVGGASRAALRLVDDISFPLSEKTRFAIRGSGKDGQLEVELLKGSINLVVGSKVPLRVITPHGSLESSTADYALTVEQERAALSVFEGSVALRTPQGSMDLRGDESAYFTEWAAPKRDIALKPRDSVHWVVQYPAILPKKTGARTPWSGAVEAFETGRSLDALIALDQVRPEDRSAEYHAYRAHVLLLAGREQEAAASIDAAMQAQPGLAEAWALRAILDLGKNELGQAQANSAKAIQLNPESPAAHLAQSYVLQAQSRQMAALQSAKRMAQLAPDSALAHARVAELELVAGELESASLAAERAVSLEPNSSDAQSILGYVRMGQDRDGEARSAFESAVKLNSADARARMGLGLVRIRQGELQAGREDLELAASLDPENALLHTYLGRSYDEEGRAQDAARQYAYARKSDPNDPTPYFFWALQLKELNLPVSARGEMEAALSRNENRSIYRGRDLLDEDRVMRQANAIGLDRSLGFSDLARVEASVLAASDPSSSIAHRALGDALATTQRSGITRQSEYYLSSLNAPLGALPTPLSLTDNVRSGAASASPQQGFFQAVEPGHTGYNEYGAIFNRRTFQAQADALYGENDTLGEQTRLSGANGALGFSFSHLHFQTDGFGQNDREGINGLDRLRNTIWRGVVQADLTDDTRLHIERKVFSSSRGVLSSAAEPFYFAPQDTQQSQHTWRVGVRQRLDDSQELLLSNTRDVGNYYIANLPTINNGLPSSLFQDIRSHVSVPEMQYRYHGTWADVVVGKTYVRSEEDWDWLLDFGSGPEVFNSAKFKAQSQSMYGYLHIKPSDKLSLDVGYAREKQKNESGLNQRKNSPKLGVRWEVLPGGTLRLVSMHGINRFIGSGTTLEPTQVAGFNQFHDDSFAYVSKQRGIAWDQRINSRLSWGVERTLRAIGSPGNTGEYTWSDEQTTRAYANWMLPRNWTQALAPGWEGALAASYDSLTYARPDSSTGLEQVTDYTPRHLRMAAKLFQPLGLEMELAATRVLARGTHYVLDIGFNSESVPFSNQFWIWDASVAYNLPGKQGKIIFGGMNLGDKRLGSYVEIDPLMPRFAPSRFLYGKLLLNF